MTETELMYKAIQTIIESGGISTAAIAIAVLVLRPHLLRILDLVLGLSRREEQHKKDLPDIMLSTMQLNAQVTEMLDAARRTLSASRIYIFSYHNGGHSIAGLNFIKASCTHELVSLGTRPQQMLLQNLPITMFCAFNQRVLNKEGVRCVDIACFAESDPSTYETLKMQGIKSIYCVGLYAQSGTPIGFMGVDYCDDFRELTDAEINELENVGVRVSSIMCLAGGGNPLCTLTEQK